MSFVINILHQYTLNIQIKNGDGEVEGYDENGNFYELEVD